MINFEWDEKKRESNLEKHGIDFVDTIGIFNDLYRIELESPRQGEQRCKTIGNVHDVIIVLVYTNRSEKKRIISARLASKKERDLYNSLR